VSKTALEINEHSLFLAKLSEADKRVLLLDYDGTIAPFSRDRHRAFPYPGIPELLRRIGSTCNTRLIVITGRPAHEVLPLLGFVPCPEIWGTYGLERLYGTGTPARHCYEEAEVSDKAAEVLAQAEIRLDMEGLQDRVEVKLAGVAVHWRGLPPSEILKIRTKAYRVLEPLARNADLVMAEFDEGVELRLRSASKGNALRTFLSELDASVPVAYLGDDATDEDAFRVLNGRGLSVLVRAKHTFTSAQMWLRPPVELIAFLKDWIRACGR
jgi:trehalose 6-phosphate phosphatase